MAVFSPKLAPKSGYVEVEIDGKRTYRNVNTGILIEQEPDSNASEDDDIWSELSAAIQEGVNEV